MSKFILKVECKSRPGVVAEIATFLASNNCNITDSSQYDDLDVGGFFMRISFDALYQQEIDYLRKEFTPIANKLDMNFQLFDTSHRMKVMLFVSKFGHCLNDLLYRYRIGAMPVEIVGVISNHERYRGLVENQDVPFHYIPVAQEDKASAEIKQLQLLEETKTDLVILARYMQILSDRMCSIMSGRIINIHHSFLPSFKGANPYKQAHNNGVKLIGATSHYVTANLDEGPIIEQDVVRVSHAHSNNDFVALGRDVESQVLSRAIHAHIHHRTFIAGNKTIIFPASPNSYASERMG